MSRSSPDSEHEKFVQAVMDAMRAANEMKLILKEVDQTRGKIIAIRYDPTIDLTGDLRFKLNRARRELREIMGNDNGTKAMKRMNH